MQYEITMRMRISLKNRTQVQKVRDALAPFVKYFENTNEGADNEENSYLEVRKCNHDSGNTIPDEIIYRFEAGKGQVV